MINYSEKIKEYRQIKFLTQTDLAKILNVSLVTVNRWENGKYEPTMQLKKKLFLLFTEAKMNLE